MATSRQVDPRVLAKEIVALQVKRAEVGVKASDGGQGYARDAKLATSTAVLMDTADQMITSATSVYEGSVAGGSDIGGPTGHVTDWLSALDSVEEGRTSPSSSTGNTQETSTFPKSEPREHSETPSRVSKLAEGMHNSSIGSSTDIPLENEESSGDEDIEIELARNARNAGEKALANGDYRSAKSSLHECLALVEQLPHKRRASVCRVWVLRHKLAICSFYLDDHKQAEAVLQEVLKLEPSSDEERRALFDISHLLALNSLGAAKLDLARQSCQNVLRGRRKLLGKTHSEYFDSLALMHNIYQRMNMPIRAEGYLSLIPESDREHYLTSVNKTEQTIQENGAESSTACNPVRSTSDVEGWRKKCASLEDELASLQKERSSSRASLQAVEEGEMRVRAERAERARLALELRMAELLSNKKKNKSSLTCF